MILKCQTTVYNSPADMIDDEFLFDDAADFVASAHGSFDEKLKLELYALYKQALSGKCDASKPGIFDIVGRRKWSVGHIRHS
jgi:acyl-CoA-binding protein